MNIENMKLESIQDIGETVICDMCGDDLSDSDESGGFLFLSNAVCPHCADERLKSIRSYNEEKHIRAFCPSDMSFKDWVLQLRGGNNTIRTYSSK